MRVVMEAGPRLTVSGDILNYAEFFLPDDKVPYEEKAFDKHVRQPPGPDLLRKARDILAKTISFEPGTLKSRIEDLAMFENAKPGPISQSLRVAVLV